MAKPNKVRYSGMLVAANGCALSRVQNVSIGTDLGNDESKELSNTEVVEFAAQNPQVSISIQTNEYGSARNIRAIAGISGGGAGDIVTQNNFDNMAVDITLMTEETNVLQRTAHINDAYLSNITWNYDVGGAATESFTFEADNKQWYVHSGREAFALPGIQSTAAIDGTGSGSVAIPLSTVSGMYNTTNWKYQPYLQYIDGVQITGALSIFSGGDLLGGITTARVQWVDNRFTTTGYRYRTLILKTGQYIDTRIPQRTSTSSIGSVTRGKLDIYLSTGTSVSYGSNNTTNFLRLQSVAISADLAREQLNELGHYRAYERSLTYPVPVNVTFNALSSDLQEWAGFQQLDFNSLLITSFGITAFTKTAALQVRIFDKQDTDSTRSFKKSITITGLQITNESIGADVGGNATQDYTAKSSNFLVSGSGTPGIFPIEVVPTD